MNQRENNLALAFTEAGRALDVIANAEPDIVDDGMSYAASITTSRLLFGLNKARQPEAIERDGKRVLDALSNAYDRLVEKGNQQLADHASLAAMVLAATLHLRGSK